MTEAQVLKALADYVGMAGSQSAAAKSLGCSLSYVHDVLAGRRAPGPKILAALGFTRTDYYEKVKP